MTPVTVPAPAPSPARRRVRAVAGWLSLVLLLAPLRRAAAEDRIDFKYMYYQEDDDRIRVLSPAVLLEKEFASGLTLRLEGIYNAISGASPTGAPYAASDGQLTPAATDPYSSYAGEATTAPAPAPTVTRSDDRDDDRDDDREGEREEEREDEEEFEDGVRWVTGARLKTPALPSRLLRRLHAVAGASPAPEPPPPEPPPAPAPSSDSGSSSSSSSDRGSSSSQPAPTPAAPAAPAPAAPTSPAKRRLPRAEIEDERVAANVELIKRLGSHTVSALFSFSTETDYESIGLAVRDAIDFNKKNTTLNLGAAFTHDTVEAYVRGTSEDKDTVEGMVGLTQVLSPKTLLTLNLTLGRVEGYLDDQYKVVWLNGALAPEHRPDQKDKHIAYVALLRYIETLRGSAELGYRFYDDTFGIQAHTFTLAWHQKLGPALVLSPMVRWYEQSEADFYGTEFAGTPTYYSSDYRVSALQAMGYGLKLVWRPTPAWSLDLAAERYEQEGTDGLTPDETYPAANLVTGGIRLWF